MRRIVFLALSLAAILPLAAADKAYYWSALETCNKAKDHAGAAALLEKAVAEFPDEPDFRSNLAYKYCDLRQYDKALNVAETAIVRHPDHKWVKDSLRCALVNLGWFRVERKDFPGAAAAFRRAHEGWPDDADAANGWGYLLYDHLQRPADAIPVLEAALARHPAHKWLPGTLAWAHQKHAETLLAARRTNEAFAAWRRFWDIGDKSNPDVVNTWGNALQEHMGRADEAIPLLAAALAAHPGHKWLPNTLAWAHYRLGERQAKAGVAAAAHGSFMAYWRHIDRSYWWSGVNLLWKLAELKRFADGEDVIAETMRRHGTNADVRKTVFWFHWHAADHARTGLAPLADKTAAYTRHPRFYTLARERDLPWQEGKTFLHLAISRWMGDIQADMDAVCPYWRPFRGGERAAAHALLALQRRIVPAELTFMLRDLAGWILYREGKKPEAMAELYAAYDGALAIPNAGPLGYRDRLTVRFPVRGICNVAGRESRQWITHAGLQRHCYDILGADEAGREITPGVDAAQSLVGDWYGFGREVVAAADGVVEGVEHGNPDDPVYPAALGKGNSVQVRDARGRHFNYYHLKQGSVRVKKGDKVVEGQVIAQLGNSSSTAPHLHFGVHSPDWLVSLPVAFKAYDLIKNGVRTRVTDRQASGTDIRETVEGR